MGAHLLAEKYLATITTLLLARTGMVRSRLLFSRRRYHATFLSTEGDEAAIVSWSEGRERAAVVFPFRVIKLVANPEKCLPPFARRG